MALRMRSPLPSLEGAAAWVNGEVDISQLAGKPVLVHFWSISCHTCHEVVDQITAWREKYAPRGLEFVSVHQPRSAEDLDLAKITADAQGPMQLTQPVAIDSAHEIVERFTNQYVPAYYLFDREHQLRHFQAGDKGYDRIEAAIERILSETPHEVAPTP
jgi:thioredoxin-like negative regulator of GroEL